MVNVEESLAGRQLIRLLNSLQTSYCEEHADRGAQGKEVGRLKVQGMIDHRHLNRTKLSEPLKKTLQGTFTEKTLFVTSRMPKKCHGICLT